MAEQKSRIYSLPEITEINDDMYLMLDASDTGARKFNLKTFYDKVDGVQASADAANTAATAAAAAVDSANQAAQQAASAAESASTTVQGLVDDVNEAIEAVGDISEQAVPTMSPTVKGGAKLGTGLDVTDGTLSVNTMASGDGSTAGPILSLDAKGWAEQDSTTGKNLLDMSWMTEPIISNGITFTPVLDSNGSLLYVKASGTSTGRAAMGRVNAVNLAAGTYTFSVGFAGSSSGATANLSYTVGGTTQYVDLSGHSELSFTLTEAATLNLALEIRVSGVTVSDLRFLPMIELGSTATAYEPYTGGAPSPSPSFPQEIRVCSGRNLLPTTMFIDSQSDRYQISHVDDGGIRVTKTDAFGGRVDLWNDPQNPIVITSDCLLYVEGKNPAFDFSIGDASNANSGANISGGAKQAVVHAGSYTRISLYLGSNATDTIIYPQLERGSVATPYVPYGYVGMEAQGRNLLPFNKLAVGQSETLNGVTYKVNHDKSITLSGTATTQVNLPSFFSGQISFSDEEHSFIALPTGVNILGVYADGAGGINGHYTVYSGSAWANGARGHTFSAMYVQVRSGATVNATIYLQIERGNHATAYQPYYHSTTPIPLPSRGWVASLPDGTADTLTLDGAGKVTWEKKTDEVVLDGSESWEQVVTNVSEKYRYSYHITGIATWTDTTSNDKRAMTSRFIAKSNYDTDRCVTGFHRRANGSSQIVFYHNGEAVADWKTWLASNPVTVLYPLATPVTEDAGYIEMPEIPVNASISIPELDDLGVKYCVDASASDLAMMWYDRARGEYADRLDGLDDDLVDTYGEIISANARIDTVSMDEDYDRQALNGTYAGRNIQTILGTNSFDATISSLHSRIASANFSGLRVGDFLNVNCGTYGTVRFDIAHFDPYYQRGSSPMGHHIAFVAHLAITMPSGDTYGTGTNNAYLAWNTTNTNQGTEAENCPYLASHLHDWEINKLLPAMPTSLTNNLINRWEYLETRYAAGSNLTASTGRTWKQLGKVWSLSEMEVYGAVVWGTPGQSVGIDRQFDIFRSIHSQLHGSRTTYWLRTPSGSSVSLVCGIDGYGSAGAYHAATDWIRSRSGFLLG